MPMSVSLSTTAAWTMARWPTVTRSPTSVGCPGSECSTQPSWRLESAPTTMRSLSARTTDPYHTLERAPMVTSPTTVAPSATQASGATSGSVSPRASTRPSDIGVSSLRGHSAPYSVRAVSVRVRLLGTGDAFGTGGRLQTCFLVEHDAGRVLVDCGPAAVIALRRDGLAPETIDAVLLSHLHGDHFGGLPFLLLEAHYVSRRERPLTIVGPPGTPARVEALMEATFPGSWSRSWRYDLDLVELEPGGRRDVGPVGVRAWEVSHPSGAPSLALRLEVEGRVFAYSGDTEWVPALAEAARGADLFVTECFRFEPGVRYHLDHETLAEHRAELDARRVVLTHLGPQAWARRAELSFEVAEDGMTLEL